MDLICDKCQAKFWKDAISKNNFTVCCKNGKVLLPDLKKAPKYLRNLLDNNIEFRNSIRGYNSILAFTPLGANIDEKLIKKKGNYCFRIHGCIYHYIGPLFPEQQSEAKCAQIYIYDSDFQANRRLEIMQH